MAGVSAGKRGDQTTRWSELVYTIGDLALDVAHGLAGQDGQIDTDATTDNAANEIIAPGGKPRNVPRMRLGGIDAGTQPVDKPSCERSRSIQPRILEVGVLCIRPEGGGEGLREHPKHAQAAHQVAVFEDAASISNKAVRVQASSDATADQSAMYSTHDGVWHRT